MMLFVTVFFIFRIICSDEENIIEGDVFKVVYDRRIFDYRCVNLKYHEEVILSREFLLVVDNNTFLCDRFFPNLYFAKFRLNELKRSTNKNVFVISCLTEKQDLLFEFKIELDPTNIKVSNFYDNEKAKLNLRKFKNDKYDVFILSNKEKNFVSIKNSLNYSEKIESFNLFYSKILVLKDFCIDKKFDFFLDKIYNSGQFDPSFLTDIGEFKRAKIITINICFLIHSLIFIPGLPKAEFCSYFEYYGERLTEIFESLSSFIDSSRNNIVNLYMPDENSKADLIKTLDDAITLLDSKLENLEQHNVFLPIFGFKSEIESLDLFLENILATGFMNTQAVLDCNINIIDKFLDLFMYILIEYCEILDRSEVVSLYSHYFHEDDVIQTNYDEPLAIYRDIFISKKLKQYLEGYQNDKTDFLIFSETSYFKFELALIIDNIVKDLIMAFDLKEKQNSTLFGPTENLLNESIAFKQKIYDFKINWDGYFNSFGKLNTLSFDNVLKKLYKEEIKSIDKKPESIKEEMLSDNKSKCASNENAMLLQVCKVDQSVIKKLGDVCLNDELDCSFSKFDEKIETILEIEQVIIENYFKKDYLFDVNTGKNLHILKKIQDKWPTKAEIERSKYTEDVSMRYLEIESLDFERTDLKDEKSRNFLNGKDEKLVNITKEKQLYNTNKDLENVKKELFGFDKEKRHLTR